MRRILLISGLAGSGKSTIARHISHLVYDAGYIPSLLKFADPLYELHHKIYQHLFQYGIAQPTKTDRRLLQVIGSDWGRHTLGPNVWADILKHRMDKILSIDKTVVIVDDVRFRNEITVAPRQAACLVRLNATVESRRNRAAKWADTPHESESALDGYTDYDLTFDTSNSYLEDQARVIFEWMKSR